MNSVQKTGNGENYLGPLCVAEFPEDTKFTMVEKSLAIVMILWN